jgi:hypothetical protein
VQPVIGVEEIEVFRRTDARSVILPRHQLVTRDDEASTDDRPVYTVCSQRVRLTAVGGGFTAEHADCLLCRQTGVCFRVLAAVDAEGTRRYIQATDATYRATKRAMAQ